MLTTWIRIENFRTVGMWIDVFGGTTDDESLLPLTLYNVIPHELYSIGITLYIQISIVFDI